MRSIRSSICHDFVELLFKRTTRTKEEKLISIQSGLDGLEEKVEYAPGDETTTIYFDYFDDSYGSTVLYISAGPSQQQVMEDTFRRILSTFQMKK
jgi:hypothetical protein